MESTLFSFKRIFHTSISLGKRLLTEFRLTPSRFDMLHLLFRRSKSTRQSELRRVLGVTASTVSRMLASLEALGLVFRTRPTAGDRRQRDVNLTDQGRERIRRAMHAMYEGNFVAFTINSLVLQYWAEGTDRQILAECRNLDAKLYMIRRNLGDRATLVHNPYGYEPPAVAAG